jgi:hypothetical protein
LGPGVEKETSQKTTTPITIEYINRLNAGTHAIYAYGEITYRDIFGKKRYTMFRYYRNIITPSQGNRMTVCNEGNEAN